MTSFIYNITTDFSNGFDMRSLSQEIFDEISTSYTSIIYGDTLELNFSSTLSEGDQTTLSNIISNHNPSVNTYPFTVSTTINAGDIYTTSHFLDPNNRRIVDVKHETTDSYNDTTYQFNDTLTSDYNISDTNTGELNDSSYILKGSGYTEGSNIANTGTASASSETQPAGNAIDGNVNTFWYNLSTQPAVGSWWKLDFGSITGIYGLEVVWYSTTYYATDVSIEYSNDNSNWSLGLRDQSITYTSAGKTTGTYKFASFSSPIFARYFRLTCNASNNSTYFIMRETRFFHADPYGFSTVNNATINNIKANRQIDTEIWNTINSVTLNGTFPANTTTHLLLSFDDQTTWVYWNGSAWTSSSLANIATTAMTHTTFNSLTSTNFNAANGLNSGTKTIDVAINIKTTNSTRSPIITNITFNITTKTFQENIGNSLIRVRYVTSSKTEFKNISNENKYVNITILPN